MLPACKRGFYNLEPHTNEFVYTALSFAPVTATASGFHRFAGDFLDEMLDDYSEAALSKQRKFYHDFDHGFRKIPRERISPQDQADYDLILDQIQLALLELDVIQSYKHNPTIYVETLGNAFSRPIRSPIRRKTYDSTPSSAGSKWCPRTCAWPARIWWIPPRFGTAWLARRTWAISR